MYRFRLLVLVALISFAFARSSFAQQKPPPAPENDPLYMRVVATPYPPEAQILDGAGHRHSAYELYVTNFGKTPLKITKLDVQGKDDDKVVVNQPASGKQLAAMFVPATSGDASKPNDPSLKPGETSIFFIFADWIPDQGDPDTFETAITIEQHGERSGSGTIHAAALEINQDDPIVIRSPLRGKNWLAANGPSNTSAHRRAMLPINGQPHIGQRYAIDWIQLGGDGNSFTGDKRKNSNYHAWDQEIHAVANGKIVAVKDGIPENVPNCGKTAVPITYETLAGNHIIQDLGDGHFAAYAHLRPGTLKVKVGDNIFYRFRHFSSNQNYGAIPARLRMQSIRTHGTDPADFELWCLAVSAVNGCQVCVDSHEQAGREKGLSAETVIGAIRIHPRSGRAR